MGIIDDLKLQFHSGDITTRLIFWNIILFALPFITVAILKLFKIEAGFLDYVSLSSNPSDLLWKPWSPVTYAFFHAGIWHILFNMLMLNFAGRLFLTFFTQKQLMGLYFTGAMFAGLIYILSYMLFPALININSSLVGASAAIMAILFATVTYAPMMQVRLIILGTVKIWHIAIVLIIIDLIQLPASNTGGHLSHLGGAFFGYIYITQLKQGRDISRWWLSVSGFFENLFSGKKKAPLRTVHKNYVRTQNKTVSKIVTKDKSQQQIDEILDKISKSGYESLTKEEKDFLFRAGKE